MFLAVLAHHLGRQQQMTRRGPARAGRGCAARVADQVPAATSWPTAIARADRSDRGCWLRWSAVGCGGWPREAADRRLDVLPVPVAAPRPWTPGCCRMPTSESWCSPTAPRSPSSPPPCRNTKASRPWPPGSTASSIWLPCSTPAGRCSSRPERRAADLAATAAQSLGSRRDPGADLHGLGAGQPCPRLGGDLRRGRPVRALRRPDDLLADPQGSCRVHLSQRLRPGWCAWTWCPDWSPQLLGRGAHRSPGGSARSGSTTDQGDTAAATDAGPLPDDRPTALILGQYLGSLQLLTWQQEIDLHRQHDHRGGRARGAEVCVFKPHPSAPPTADVELSRARRSSGRRADHRPEPGDR